MPLKHRYFKEIKHDALKPVLDIEKYQKEGQLILAVTSHEDDEYHINETGVLTTYGAHCEGLTCAMDGMHVLVWGGEYVETGEYGDVLGYIGPWWFVNDGTFETPANPILYLPIVD